MSDDDCWRLTDDGWRLTDDDDDDDDADADADDDDDDDADDDCFSMRNVVDLVMVRIHAMIFCF